MTSTLTGGPATEAHGRRRKLVIGGSILAAVLAVGVPIVLKMRGSDEPARSNAGNTAAPAPGETDPAAAPAPDPTASAVPPTAAAPEISPILIPRSDAEVFWRSASGGIGHATLTTAGAWKGPESTGSGVDTTPSAVLASGAVHLFWKGTDQQLWSRKYTPGSGWGEPKNLNMGKVNGAPRAVAGPDGSIDVFWWGVDGQLWNAATSDASSWRGPTELGGKLASDPSPVASAAGVLEVLWKGTDNSLWHQRYEPGKGWVGAQDLKMSGLVGPPRAVSDKSGAVDVFWRGAGDEMIHAYLVVGKGWLGPERMGGQLATEPTPTITELGAIRVVWRAKDGSLGQHWYTGDEWQGPQNVALGGVDSISGNPVALGRPNGEIELFWVDAGRQLWHSYWTPTTQWIGPAKVG
jgi:hypothetical protein